MYGLADLLSICPKASAVHGGGHEPYTAAWYSIPVIKGKPPLLLAHTLQR
ncbi:MAG: hypothetical protein M0P01_00890 [Treponema sp.]|nr:hypothetical protein [Treponema sp.]